MVEIYTDGSSRANGTKDCEAGWAMVIPNFKNKMFVRYGYLPPPSSNNKGEILGVLYAMSVFHKGSLPITIFSDSRYVVDSCNKWRHNWALTNYEDIKNRALLLPLFNFIDSSQIKPNLVWIKGHAGNHGNELADRFCAYGKDRVIKNKQDDVSDIKFIAPEELGFVSMADLTAI